MNVRKSFTALALLFLGWSAAHAEQYTIPLFLAPGTSGDPQGVLRLVNDTGEAATVQVFAIADDGTRTGPATIALGASAAAEFDATELRSANAAKGLSGGLGSFSSDVRLLVDSDAPIVPLAFVRVSDGTLSAMHDAVRAASTETGQYSYEVPIFNLSTVVAQASRLRLINPGDAPAAVTIAGRDDGASAGTGTVQLSLPAGGARTLTAQQLEAGGTGLTGRLGAGIGRWRLTVTSDRLLSVVNVVASSTGHWNNLSTTAVRGAAPADLAGFNHRFVGQSAILETEGGRSSFAIMANGRFSETVQVGGMFATGEGGYEYVGLGPDAGRLTLDYDDGEQCRSNWYFSSRMGGWFASHCTGGMDAEETWSGGNWSVGEDDGDDHGDAFDTATGVSVPSVTPGELEQGKEDGDRDYFRVTVSAATTLTVETTGRTDTYGTLFDANRAQLATNDDGGAGTNFRIERQVPAGSYYVEVRGYRPTRTGSYELRVSAADDTPGGGGGQATTFGSGDTISSLPSGNWFPDVTSGGSFSSSGGNVTIRLNNGGYIEEGDYRYTCQSAGGCTVLNGSVQSGTIAQTSKGSAPSDGDDGGGGGGTGAPDLTVGSVSVSDASPAAGASFTLRSTVRNGGDASAAATTLRYYRSTNATISRSDTQVGTDSVSGLSASGTSAESISLTAPLSAGTYYYGACVDAVAGESDTDNNCSSGVRVAVESAGGGAGGGGGGGQATTFGSGDTISSLPSGNWFPDVTSGGSFSSSGGNVTIRLNNGGYIEEGDYRYTCQSAGGCTVLNGSVQSGTIAQTSKGSAPSDGDDGGGGGGTGAPDLTVGSVSVSDASPAAGASFTLRSTVRNGGDASAAATTLRYYRSTNATISQSDTQVGTDSVSGLSASGTSAESISLTAPLSAGTYYYGACVDAVAGESDTDNNCSSGVRVAVESAGGGAGGGGGGGQATTFGSGDTISSLPSGNWFPDVTSGGSFSSSGGNVTIRLNNGGYIEEGDYRYTCQSAGGCTVLNGSVQSGTIAQTSKGSAPSDGDDGGGGGGTGAPDLTVGSVSVSDASPAAGASFTLRSTVRNGGDASAAATTLRYYRSTNATISRSDTQVGTDSVSGLSASGTSAESISLTAPSSTGTYYYGACVDSVAGESDTDNNCSSGVRVTVADDPSGGSGDGACRAGLVVNPGESCTYKGSTFRVSSSGRGSISFFGAGTSIDIRGSTINGVRWNFYASKNSGSNSWTIHVAD